MAAAVGANSPLIVNRFIGISLGNNAVIAHRWKKEKTVGLSNKLDSELNGRKPVKRSHGQVVGTAIMDGKLLCKIVQ